MVRIDLSDLVRLGNEYQQRAARIGTNPFGGRTQEVEDALRDALKQALGLGTTAQSALTNDYIQTGKGHYGSSPQGDQSKINPQEWLDPSGVADIKRKTGQTGPHKSFYGSSKVVVEHGSGTSIFKLTTDAEMKPYPNDRVPIAEQTWNESKPIMYYLRHGWVDPYFPKHKMNKRPFGQHVINAFKPFLAKLSRIKLLAEGFKEKV